MGGNQIAGAVVGKLNAAFLAIASQVAGDLLYADTTTTFTRLGIGTAGQVLSVSSGIPAWSTLPNTIGPGAGNGGLVGGGGALADSSTLITTAWWTTSAFNNSNIVVPLSGWLRNLTIITSGNAGTQPANILTAISCQNCRPIGQVWIRQNDANGTVRGTYQTNQDPSWAGRLTQFGACTTSLLRSGGTAGVTPKGWTAEFVGDDGGQPIGGAVGNTTIAGSTTRFQGPWSTQGYQTTNAAGNVPLAAAGTIKNFCFVTSGAGPSGGTLAATVMVNSVASSVTASFAASATQGWACDFTNTATINANDEVSVRFVNGSASTSAGITGWSAEFLPSASKFLIGGGSGIGSLATNTTNFAQAFGGTINATEAASEVPLARAGTVSKLCVDLSAASAQTLTATLEKNGSDTALAVTTTANTTGVTCGTTGGPISYAQGDTMSLKLVQQNGGGASTPSGWSIDFQ